MAKPNQAQEQTMEEILASIRRIISDDEARSTAKPPARELAPKPVNNVSHLFAEPFSGVPPKKVVELPAEQRTVDDEPLLITEAFAQAMEAPDRADDYTQFRPEPPKAAARPATLPAEAEARPSPPLLSARADAQVTSAFTQLADTIFSGKSRTIDTMVEDMLRPMLKTWLDNNLPPLVERMVREEIERVSRGGR